MDDSNNEIIDKENDNNKRLNKPLFISEIILLLLSSAGIVTLLIYLITLFIRNIYL